MDSGFAGLPGPRDPLPEEGQRSGPARSSAAANDRGSNVDPAQAEQMADAMVAKLRQTESTRKAPDAMRSRGIRVAVIIGGSLGIAAVLLGLALIFG